MVFSFRTGGRIGGNSCSICLSTDFHSLASGHFHTRFDGQQIKRSLGTRDKPLATLKAIELVKVMAHRKFEHEVGSVNITTYTNRISMDALGKSVLPAQEKIIDLAKIQHVLSQKLGGLDLLCG